MTLPLFLDAGNAFAKWVVGKNEGMFIHAIAELTPAQYEYATERFGRSAPLDLLRIGSTFYAVGETAENFNITRRSGRTKYDRTYYGVLFARAVADAFVANPDYLREGLTVFASHATDDFGFRSDVVKAIKGKWRYECAGKPFEFEVKVVKTFEESFGGYCRVAIHYDGKKWTLPLQKYSAGVIDIGGGTCGVLAVNERGIVQPSMSKSGSVGVLNAIERLKKELERKYSELFKTSQNPPSDRIREALITGEFRGFGRKLDCVREAEIALNPLMNEVKNLWMQHLSGGAGMDYVILTGGGNAILAEKVCEVIGRGENEGVVLADDRQTIQFANVRGARNFADLAGIEGLL